MKMKSLLPAALIAVALLFASTHAAAQEVGIRKGEVTAIAPVEVEVPAEQPQRRSSTSSALSRSLGRLAGRTAARATGGYSYDAYDVASSATRDATDAAADVANTPKAGVAYMVMIRFDDGSESAIQTDDASQLAVGGRVRVLGSGSSAQLIPGG